MRGQGDFRPLGDHDGRTPYYVQDVTSSTWGNTWQLKLIVVDEFGTVEETPVRAPYDAAAPTVEEAVIHHLNSNGVVKQAMADLERRRKDAPPEPEEPPPAPPIDPATRRFLDD